MAVATELLNNNSVMQILTILAGLIVTIAPLAYLTRKLKNRPKSWK